MLYKARIVRANSQLRRTLPDCRRSRWTTAVTVAGVDVFLVSSCKLSRQCGYCCFHTSPRKHHVSSYLTSSAKLCFNLSAIPRLVVESRVGVFGEHYGISEEPQRKCPRCSTPLSSTTLSLLSLSAASLPKECLCLSLERPILLSRGKLHSAALAPSRHCGTSPASRGSGAASVTRYCAVASRVAIVGGWPLW